jgi:methylmalonyl-CoA mutase C-terminal domain/subunit
MEALRARGVDDAVVFAGGIIPEDDVPAVKAMGIKEVFGPGASLDEIVRAVRQVVAEQRAKTEGLT